jgi:hypothetical protein
MAKSEKSSRDKGLQERVVVLVDAEQREWLQAQSESTGAPIGAIIRRAIEAYRLQLKKK